MKKGKVMDAKQVKQYEENLFNETVLYEALGKDDARTVLGIWNEYKAMKGLSLYDAVNLARNTAMNVYCDNLRGLGGGLAKNLQEILDGCALFAITIEQQIAVGEKGKKK